MEALGLCFVGMTLLLLIGNALQTLWSPSSGAQAARVDRTDHRAGGIGMLDFAAVGQPVKSAAKLYVVGGAARHPAARQKQEA